MTQQQGGERKPHPGASRNGTPPREGQDAATEAAWKPSRLVRLSLLAVLAVVGVVYLVEGLSLPFGSLQQPDYGFFPVLVGVLFLASVAITMLRQSLTSSEAEHGTEAHPGDTANFRWGLAAIIAALLAYVLFADVVGHISATAFLSAVALRITGNRPWWQVLLFGIAMGLGSYLLFAVVLGMQLPRSMFRLDL